MTSIEQIKKLREETGVSIMECKKALQEANGDLDEAREILRKKGKDIAVKKSTRTTEEGIIASYIHPNKKIGVLLDIRCETDFVAKSQDFQELAHELCLQIAAMAPLYISKEEVPRDILEREKEIYKGQFQKENKPEEVLNKIIEGKLEKYFEEVCLLDQAYIKDPERKISEIIQEKIAKLGENITIKRFVRYQI
jgi:elongation factor Ts